MKKLEENNNLDEKIRIETLAERIKLLFGFCVELIPDIDLLEKTAASADERAGFAMSAAPILTAAGLDYEEKEFEWRLRERRASALANLLKVLDETEKERAQHAIEREKKAGFKNDIAKMFNL